MRRDQMQDQVPHVIVWPLELWLLSNVEQGAEFVAVIVVDLVGVRSIFKILGPSRFTQLLF